MMVFVHAEPLSAYSLSEENTWMESMKIFLQTGRLIENNNFYGFLHILHWAFMGFI